MEATTAALTQVRTFDVYGLRVRVESDWHEVLESVRLDLAWFEAPADAAAPDDVRVRIERRAPDFDAYGDVVASFITPRNVVYQLGDHTLVDYFGRALSLVDASGTQLLIQGELEHLVHEAAYHFITSVIGRHLDSRGLPRLHGLGLAGPAGGAVVMLPSGGGKSTMAMRALEDQQVAILSEDTPLIDRRGRLHPFVLRIGINATDAERLPADQVRRIERMEFHPKLALEVSAFADRVTREPVPLRHLVIGRRSLGHDARLEPLPRRAALGTLFREAVVGVGVYQGMEFVLQRGMRDVFAHAGTAGMRARCCLAGLARAQVWELTVGRDHERNWQVVRELLG
jgi:hypothetical protein